MNEYKDFFYVLDQIRQQKDIRVSDLCDGIISERTYYRHLNQNTSPKMKTFEELANKLGVSPYDVLHYSIFTPMEDPSVLKFLYRVQIGLYYDINQYYEKMLVHHNESEDVQLLIQATIKKYERSINKIDDLEYQEFLIKSVKDIENMKVKNIFNYAIYSLLFEELPTNNLINPYTLFEEVLKMESHISILVFIITCDNLLRTVIGNSLVDNELSNKLLDKLSNLLCNFRHKYFLMEEHLFIAYREYINNNTDEVLSHLYKYLINLMIMIEGEEFDKRVKKIEDTFSINYQELINSETLNKLKEKPFQSN
jgi:transcriptional regulator with XRE-family HTH domain